MEISKIPKLSGNKLIARYRLYYGLIYNNTSTMFTNMQSSVYIPLTSFEAQFWLKERGL
jgi:hypothetical protein